MGLIAESPRSDIEPTPPEALRWAFFLQHGVRPICTFVRRRDGTAWGPARIVVSYPGAQPALPPDVAVAWDPVLEDWLLEHHIAAQDEANEVARFGHALERRFEALERRTSGSAFTAALLRCLYDHRCELYQPLERKLGAIRTYEPDPSTAETAVGAEIKRVMHTGLEALEALGYPQDRARAMFVDALAYYLRDRFEI